MTQAKRVKGTRDAPYLPKLMPKDFRPEMWRAVNLPAWTLMQAAHYSVGTFCIGNIDPTQPHPPSKMYLWLAKEIKETPLKHNVHEELGMLFSPGDVFRYLWEAERDFKLEVWALYDYASRGEIDGTIHSAISTENYKVAAAIVWKKFPKATKRDVAGFLINLSFDLVKGNGLPILPKLSLNYIEKLLKSVRSASEGGRPKGDASQKIDPHDTQLIAEILSELGQ